MKLIVICGATATGKSDLAVSLAQHINGEIINADSMQLYKGMDIGTAKITIEEQKGIPHHMMDLLEVNQDANVAWYQEQARNVISEIHGRGKDAIIVGGTGLYIKAILDELNFPDTDPVVRAERRFKELQATQPTITMEEVAENLTHRDLIDSTREHSPLKQAEDALVLDNTHLNQEEQFSIALNWAKERIEA
mgnify:CR=1 FL=1